MAIPGGVGNHADVPNVSQTLVLGFSESDQATQSEDQSVSLRRMDMQALLAGMPLEHLRHSQAERWIIQCSRLYK